MTVLLTLIFCVAAVVAWAVLTGGVRLVWRRWRLRRDPLGYMRHLADIGDHDYQQAMNDAFRDVLGEDPPFPHVDTNNGSYLREPGE